jgi:hypothetical protein
MNMPYPPAKTPPVLPRDVALRVAHLAGVPAQKCEPFCDAVCESVEEVWKRDRRAVSSKPGEALIKAAEAAQTLNEAFGSLKKEDREWVEGLFAQKPWSHERLPELPRAVWLIAFLFSTAIGKFLPIMPGTATLRDKRGRRRGNVKDMTFEVLIRRLLLWATEYYGEFTFDKNSGKGTLTDALNILRSYLPKGVVPIALPLTTIQRIKTNYSKSRRLLPDLRPAK